MEIHIANLKKNLPCLLFWLPFLIVDRLSKQLGEIASPLEIWNRGDILFRNTRNTALIWGIQGPVNIANIAGILCFIALIGLCCLLQLSPKILWPLIPLTFAIVSNLWDSMLRGMVCDPVVIGVSNNQAIGFNLADVLLVIAALSLPIVVGKEIISKPSGVWAKNLYPKLNYQRNNQYDYSSTD